MSRLQKKITRLHITGYAFGLGCGFLRMALLCLLPSLAQAQTDIWQGGTGNWSNASLWSAGIPVQTSNVLIDNGNSAQSAVTVNGGYVCSNLTVDKDDSLSVPGTGNLGFFGTSIANSGKIVVDDTTGFASLGIAMGQNISLTGAGTVMLNDPMANAGSFISGGANSTLTNVNNTIEGSGQVGQGDGLILVNQKGGVINANQTGRALYITTFGGATNRGLLEATSGGVLTIVQGLAVNNAGGTISASGSGSAVTVIGTIQGGTLTTPSSGVIHGEGTLDGSTHGTVNNAGTIQVPGGHSTGLTGTINNTGTFALDDTNGDSSLGVPASNNVMLTGGGKVMMNDTTGAVAAFISGGASSVLTNVNNTIEGSGQIGQAGGLQLVNQKHGAVIANQSGRTLYLNAPAGTINQGMIEATGSTLQVDTPVTNSGTFSVAKSSLFEITNTFSNFSGTTLTGGTYTVAGTLEFPGANIVTNAANVSLIGVSAAITDLTKNDALRNLASTTNKGALSLQSGRNLITPGTYSNAGTLTVGAGTKLTVTGAYTQTGGTTTVDGFLTAPAGTTIQKGNVFGKGTITSTVVSGGAFTAGDSPKKTGVLATSTYTQNSSGTLNIALGGLTVGKQYGQLAVANGASLNGTLNVTLINNFSPSVGNAFIVLTASAVSGQFSKVNLPSLTGAHFVIAYNPNNVSLTVVSGT